MKITVRSIARVIVIVLVTTALLYPTILTLMGRLTKLSLNLLQRSAALVLRGMSKMTGAGFLDQVAIFIYLEIAEWIFINKLIFGTIFVGFGFGEEVAYGSLG